MGDDQPSAVVLRDAAAACPTDPFDQGSRLVELGDEESVTEIQLLLIEKISVLAVPFAAREVSAQS